MVVRIVIYNRWVTALWARRKEGGIQADRMRSSIREVLETLVLALVIFVLLQGTVQNFRVEGASMEPTLDNGQFVLVNKAVFQGAGPAGLAKFLPFLNDVADNSVYPFHAPQRGDIIVFLYPLDPSRDFIKRVIAIPGDVIEIRGTEVIVNGVPLENDFKSQRTSYYLKPTLIPSGEYFVMGDNRGASNDSRDWGNVPAENIVGQAWISYWPPGDMRFLSATSWLAGLW